MYLDPHCTYLNRRCQQMPFLLGLNFNQLKLAPHATTQRQVLTSKTQIALSCGANVGPKTCLPTIKFILLIMQKLYNLLLGENSVILFYNKNFMIYLVILSDFHNLN